MNPFIPMVVVGGLAFAATPALRTAALNLGMKTASKIGSTLIGSVTREATKEGTKYGLKAGLIPRTAWWGAKRFTEAAPSLAKFGMQTAGFAVRHPYLVAGGVGAGLAFNAAPTFSSPTMNDYYMKSTYNQEAIAAEAMQGGVMPTGNIITGAQIRNQRLAQSTFGLVQGLHQGRH